MQYYFAPLEGITGYVYRTTHHAFFPGVDRYYIPFAAPNYTKHFKNKEKQDMDPANNAGLHAVPQILSNKADETLWAIEEMADRGYEEINLNLGCPMPTVAKKKKGSGLLKYTDELDAYLNGVFEGLSRRDASRPDVKISIKTRLGTDTTEEAEGLVRIYNRYPLSELIVHPRSQKDLYRGKADRESFLLVLRESTNPVVYNGDLQTPQDVEEIAEICAREGRNMDSVMIGRGLLADPSLVRECRGGAKVTSQELGAFHDALYKRFQETLPGDSVVLSHMKELWFYMGNLFPDGGNYMGNLFPDGGKCLKEIRRATRRAEYEAAVRVLLSTCEVH